MDTETKESVARCCLTVEETDGDQHDELMEARKNNGIIVRSRSEGKASKLAHCSASTDSALTFADADTCCLLVRSR